MESKKGNVIWEAKPANICDYCPLGPLPSCHECSNCYNCSPVLKPVHNFHDSRVPYLSKLFNLKCYECKKRLAGDPQLNFIYYENKVWHQECFNCPNCGKSLLRFGSIHDSRGTRCSFCNRYLIF